MGLYEFSRSCQIIYRQIYIINGLREIFVLVQLSFFPLLGRKKYIFHNPRGTQIRYKIIQTRLQEYILQW